MRDDSKQTLTPKLRFPEFRDGPEWKAEILGEEGDFLSSLTGKSGEHFGVGNAKYVTYMNVFANTFTDMTLLNTVDIRDGESQNAVRSGDVLFTVSSETPEEVGMSSVVLDDVQDCYVNSFCTMFRFAEDKRPNTRFVGYLMRQPLVRTYFAKHAQGSTRFNLSKTAFENLPIAIPSPAEQQRIAECLSALDELIAGHGRKLEALRAHKKGLMQQLFPREGKKLPCLRFPEFRDAPEWKEKKGGDLFANRTESGEAGLPIYSVTMNDGMVKRSSLDRVVDDIAEPERNKRARKGDIAYNMMRMWQGALGVAGEDCMVSPAYVVLSALEGTCSDFFAYMFKLSQSLNLLTSYSRGLTKDRLRLYYADFTRVPLLVPGFAEQRKIADLLASVDALISVQLEKLAALKTHKKGLMQELFPSAERV
jgi:type I restriction enzyme, S subunit